MQMFAFRSCDGTIFKVHSRHLEITCGALPLSKFTATGGESIHWQFTEDTETLDLLFSFVYPRKQPQLLDISFGSVTKVAAAAEKYGVFNAMNICRTRMSEHASLHPLEVFVYGFNHGYNELMKKSAPLLLHLPFERVLEDLPDVLKLPWSRYHSIWKRKLIEIFTEDPYRFGSNPIESPSRPVSPEPVIPVPKSPSVLDSDAGDAVPRGKLRKRDHYLTENVLARALRSFLKTSPDGGSKMTALSALRQALEFYYHRPTRTTRSWGETEIFRSKKKSADPEKREVLTIMTVADDTYQNSLDAFEEIFEKKLAEIPPFDLYIADFIKQ